MRSSEELPIATFYDLKSLYQRRKRIILKMALICGGATCLFLLLKEPKFLAEATFQQSAKQSDVSLRMKEVFQQYMSVPAESGVLAAMQSGALLRSVMSELGVQVQAAAHGMFFRSLKNIYENIIIQCGGTLEEGDPFLFRNVRFSGEKKIALFLQPLDNESFQILDSEKNLICLGKVGSLLTACGVEMVVERMPKSVKAGKNYRLNIHPWQSSIKQVRSSLRIRPGRIDKNILSLSFSARDRHLASRFLNALMSHYQLYLKRENEEICQSQLSYLEKRQDELTKRLDIALLDHVGYLKESLAKDGHIGLMQEIDSLSEPREEYLSKLFDVDLQMKRMELFSDPVLSPKKPKQIKKKVQESSLLLNVQRDLQAIATEGARAEKIPLQPLHSEIEQTKNQIQETVLLMEAVENETSLPQVSLLSDPKSLMSILAEPFRSSSNEWRARAKPSFLQYVRDFQMHLEQKRAMLEEDFQLKQNGFSDFIGLDLAASKQLWNHYTTQRDNLQAQLRELIFLRERLSDPAFELSSAGVVFSDAVTSDLFQKASAVALQLKDGQNRTLRDHERLHEALDAQKHFLSQHLFQTIELTKLRCHLLEDKIESLRAATIALLESEKQLLSQKLQEINLKMADLPEKWRKESLLVLKKELGVRMIEGMTQLAESKNISQHLYQANSKPLDHATPPLTPASSFWLVLSLLAAALGGAGTYFYFLSQMLSRGVPLSPQLLKACGFPYLGAVSLDCPTELSQVPEADLEALRAASALVCSSGKFPQTVALAGGNYSHSLAELLGLRGMKVVLVHLQGEGKNAMIGGQNSYDFLHVGETNRYQAEFLVSPRFTALVADLKERYDLILLYGTEGKAILPFADSVLLSVKNETKEALIPYFQWEAGRGQLGIIYQGQETC